ncbi:MAG TPA: hypothetical protein ENG74_01395 [Thermoplasmatales archaeon]|nr:hypothetical protein [Thermoplasmatales archaeon]
MWDEKVSELRVVVDELIKLEDDRKRDKLWLDHARRNKKLRDDMKKYIADKINRAKAEETARVKEIEKILKEIKLWDEWLKYVKGVGPKLAGKILSRIDFEKAKSPSSLWTYCGYAVINGKRTRFQRGEKSIYRPELKSWLHMLGMSFLGYGNIGEPRAIANKEPRIDGGYARLYIRLRRVVDEKHPDWNATRRFLDARGRMIKVFLAHMYQVYSWLYNGQAVLHYAAAYLNKPEFGAHDYVYMPVVDVEEGDEPTWWRELWDAYREKGIRPVRL